MAQWLAPSAVGRRPFGEDVSGKKAAVDTDRDEHVVGLARLRHFTTDMFKPSLFLAWYGFFVTDVPHRAKKMASMLLEFLRPHLDIDYARERDLRFGREHLLRRNAQCAAFFVEHDPPFHPLEIRRQFIDYDSGYAT